jgi:hypothetical protein
MEKVAEGLVDEVGREKWQNNHRNFQQADLFAEITFPTGFLHQAQKKKGMPVHCHTQASPHGSIPPSTAKSMT